jgi:hypothetical protein
MALHWSRQICEKFFFFVVLSNILRYIFVGKNYTFSLIFLISFESCYRLLQGILIFHVQSIFENSKLYNCKKDFCPCGLPPQFCLFMQRKREQFRKIITRFSFHSHQVGGASISIFNAQLLLACGLF